MLPGAKPLAQPRLIAGGCGLAAVPPAQAVPTSRMLPPSRARRTPGSRWASRRVPGAQLEGLRPPGASCPHVLSRREGCSPPRITVLAMSPLRGTASPAPGAGSGLQETPSPAGLTHTGFIHTLTASLTQPVLLGRVGEEEEEEDSNNLILGAGRRESKPTARWFNITGPLARPKRSSPLGREEQRQRCVIPCQRTDRLSPGPRAASCEGRAETRALVGT